MWTKACFWIPLLDTTALAGGPEGLLDTVSGPRRSGPCHPDPPTARRGKEPHGVVGCWPVLAEQRQGPCGPRHGTVCGPCAVTPGDQHPCTVDSGDLQVGARLQAQPTGVNGGQTHPRAQQLKVCQNGAHCFNTEDDGELLLPWGTHKGQRGPCALEGRLIEKRDAAPGDGTGTAGGVFDVLAREEGGPACFFRDPGR